MLALRYLSPVEMILEPDKMEKALWVKANLKPTGTKYQSTGQGMGQTLTIASEKEGYTLTDRATYLATKKNLKLDILLEGETSLLNIYHVMQVNPEKFPKVNADGAKAFVDFMVNADTQKLIGSFWQRPIRPSPLLR